MKSVISITGSLALLGGALAAVTLPAAPAAAESWSQTQCEANGGQYYKNGSDSKCVYPEEQSKPGNMPKNYDGGALTTTQTTTDGNGNLTNQQTTSTSCTGHKCPK